MTRVVDTKLLFLRLLRTLDVQFVCEVGSLDGRDALRFRRTLTTADIVALEPNPSNYLGMRADAALANARIELVPAAAADFDGEAPFHLVSAPPGPEERSRRGMSSLLKRHDPRFDGPSIRTRVLRLDSLLAARVRDRRLALWIDSEGSAFETLSGASGIAPWVQLLHVEVESVPCIGARQRLYGEVVQLLQGWGFVEVATNARPDAPQFDAVFARRDASAATRLRIAFWLLALRARRALIAIVAALCAGCLHRWRERSRR